MPEQTKNRPAHLAEHANGRAGAPRKGPPLGLEQTRERLILRARDVLREFGKVELGDLGHLLEDARKVVHARARVAQEVDARVEQDAVQRVGEGRDGDIAERRGPRGVGDVGGREDVLVGRELAIGRALVLCL